jgi:NAD(P)-dependent dehydrogenase (short-subunit alcohol dehydrogenase family)
VIVHADTAEPGDQAVERLVKAGAEPLRLEAVSADFARLSEIARMARQVGERYPRLDLLLNTAHTVPGQRRVLTEDGNERTFQTNYLAPFLLTRMLAGPLHNAYGRIVSISSILHRGARLDWTDLTRTKGYTPLAAYGQAALALTMFTRTLAERASNEFTAISVDPGSEDPDVVRMHRWATTPAEHSADIITQLSSPGLTVRNGLFYEGLLPGTTAASVEDPRVQARLWRMSDRLLGLD